MRVESADLVDVPKIRLNACVVYRITAWTGLLLYVGSTNNLDRRLAEHRRNSPWFILSHAVESQVFDGPGDALEAEREAIRTERPLFNRIAYQAVTTYESTQLAAVAESDRAVAWAMDRIIGDIFNMEDLA